MNRPEIRVSKTRSFPNDLITTEFRELLQRGENRDERAIFAQKVFLILAVATAFVVIGAAMQLA